MRLLVLDNSPVLFGDTEKNLEKPLPPLPPRKLRPFGPLGGGMDIFWNYTIQPALYGHPINTDTFYGPLSIHIDAFWPHSSQILS